MKNILPRILRGGGGSIGNKVQLKRARVVHLTRSRFFEGTFVPPMSEFVPSTPFKKKHTTTGRLLLCCCLCVCLFVCFLAEPYAALRSCPCLRRRTQVVPMPMSMRNLLRARMQLQPHLRLRRLFLTHIAPHICGVWFLSLRIDAEWCWLLWWWWWWWCPWRGGGLPHGATCTRRHTAG